MRLSRALPLILVLAAGSAAGPDAKPEPKVLRVRLKAGDRYTRANTISYRLTLTETSGTRKKTTTESVQRTERFVDSVRSAGERSGFVLDRTYLKLYTKVRSAGEEKARVVRSPLSGRTLELRERRRRIELKFKEGEGTIEGIVRRTIAMELAWRDAMPDYAVKPGDSWKAEAGDLSQKMAAYLETGHRYTMRIRYEEDVEFEGVECARLYVDWNIEGMRDRHLYAKVSLAGDIYLDIKNQRLLSVDLAGSLSVRGAILGSEKDRFINGQGPVQLKMTCTPAPLQPAAGKEKPAEQPAKGS